MAEEDGNAVVEELSKTCASVSAIAEENVNAVAEVNAQPGENGKKKKRCRKKG